MRFDGAPNFRDLGGYPTATGGRIRWGRVFRSNSLHKLANGGPVYGSLLSSLSTDDGTPAVFHCAGGKDRTGLAAAMLLTWLGVDRETVLDDYELTGRYLAAHQSPEVVARMLEYGIGRDAAEALLGSPRGVMARALELVDSEYGGIEAYLRGPAELSDRTLSDLRTDLVD